MQTGVRFNGSTGGSWTRNRLHRSSGEIATLSSGSKQVDTRRSGLSINLLVYKNDFNSLIRSKGFSGRENLLNDMSARPGAIDPFDFVPALTSHPGFL